MTLTCGKDRPPQVFWPPQPQLRWRMSSQSLLLPASDDVISPATTTHTWKEERARWSQSVHCLLQKAVGLRCSLGQRRRLEVVNAVWEYGRNRGDYILIPRNEVQLLISDLHHKEYLQQGWEQCYQKTGAEILSYCKKPSQATPVRL